MRLLQLVLLALLCAASTASVSTAALLTGVSDDNQLLTFNTSNPSALLSGKAIIGLALNEDIRGIDYRPTTSVLYALGSYGNIYTINPNTVGPAVATPLFDVNADPDLALIGGLSGTSFGFDFNPSADFSGANSLRIVSNTNQNLAVNVDTGDVLVATPVAYPSGATPNIVGEAYSNSYLGGNPNGLNAAGNPNGPGTTQYAIDSGTDGLVLQAFNAGTLTPIGSLTVNTTADVGFEIITLNSGANVAYATLDADGTNTSHLYAIDLSTGAASDLGEIDGGLLVPNLTANPSLVENQVPEPAALLLCGLGIASVALRRRS